MTALADAGTRGDTIGSPAVFRYSHPPRAGFNWPYVGTLALRLMMWLSLTVSALFWIGVLAAIVG